MSPMGVPTGRNDGCSDGFDRRLLDGADMTIVARLRCGVGLLSDDPGVVLGFWRPRPGCRLERHRAEPSNQTSGQAWACSPRLSALAAGVHAGRESNRNTSGIPSRRMMTAYVLQTARHVRCALGGSVPSRHAVAGLYLQAVLELGPEPILECQLGFGPGSSPGRWRRVRACRRRPARRPGVRGSRIARSCRCPTWRSPTSKRGEEDTIS